MEINNPNNNEIIRKVWVTDPYDPEIRDKYNEIIKALNGPRFEVISSLSEILEQSITKTTYIIKEREGPIIEYNEFKLPEKKPIRVIEQQIGEIAFEPVVITMKIEHNREIEADIVNGASNLVQAFTNTLLNTEVLSVEETQYVIDNNKIIVFTPLLGTGSAIYRKSKYLGELLTICNLNKLAGYQVLTDDPLVTMVLNELESQDIRLNKEEIKIINGLVLIKVGDKYSIYKQVIVDYINTLRINGYFTIPTSLDQMIGNRKKIYMEIAKMMNITYIEEPNKLICKNDNKCDSQWFNQSYEQIITNSIPKYIIEGEWQLNESWGNKNEIKVKLYLAAFLAYSQLIKFNEILSDFITEIKIFDDLSIQIPITTLDDIINFEEQLMINMSNLIQWNVLKCDNFIDGLIKRWYITQKYQYLISLVIKIDNNEYLIINTPDRSNFDLPTNLSIAETSLTSYLKEQFYQCHDQLEPITYENINEMSLSQLINIIMIKDTPTSPTYCFLNENLQKLTVNPITRIPFTDETQRKIANHEWALRGIYSLNKLKGIITDNNVKTIIKPTSGKVVITPNQIDNQLIQSVDIQLDDTSYLFLFDIMTKDTTKLYQLVTKLWNCGWFLGSWGSALMKNFNEISSHLNISCQLLRSSDSPDDGESTMRYLENLVESKC